MFEFKVIEKLKPNKNLTDILKNSKYKVKLGKIKYPITLTILEYKVNEISNKPFYIKEYNQKYNIKEIAQF